MKIETKQQMDVAPEELARAMADDPEAFARFFFAFDEEITRRNRSGGDHARILRFAEKMAFNIGNRRQAPFRMICRYLDALEAGLIPARPEASS